MQRQNDFSQGSMAKNILALAVPMMVAQFINLLYSIVDRIYVGHIPEASSLALTGLGLTFPVISIVTAFANLFGMGGAPLCSIARGRGDDSEAEQIMGNSFAMLLLTGAALTVLCLAFKRPMLLLFGASGQTLPYADAYLSIYLLGSLFVMTSLGMNTFINSQGFGRTGMMTVTLGAVANILLDPLFIFVFGWGVRGAAAATIISQGLSAVWVMRFLTGKRAIYRLSLRSMRLNFPLIGRITALGFSGFIMAMTNCTVQIVCNATLQKWGGDLYVGVMTIINSLREMLSMPVTGLTHGSQPVLGFNFGAKEYGRVRQGIRFTTWISVLYSTFAWIILMVFTETFIHLFNSDPRLVEAGVPAVHLYFFGFFMMSFMFAGQSSFVALGKSKQAIFFSLFRKVIIVTPLTILLPYVMSPGVNGVFIAEPISNFIGGLASYLTMLYTVHRLTNEPPPPKQTVNP